MQNSLDTVIALFPSGKIVATHAYPCRLPLYICYFEIGIISKEIGRFNQLLYSMHGGIGLQTAAEKEYLSLCLFQLVEG